MLQYAWICINILQYASKCFNMLQYASTCSDMRHYAPLGKLHPLGKLTYTINRRKAASRLFEVACGMSCTCSFLSLCFSFVARCWKLYTRFSNIRGRLFDHQDHQAANMLQYVSMCINMLQHAPTCFITLQWTSICLYMPQYTPMCFYVQHYDSICIDMLQQRTEQYKPAHP